ncbi:PREDICTED: probable indole-3-pyruvate monooxygenase YUCCA10 [Nelumbo nucifera]|uniref:Flavin-containing monooxygenase n=2 Tax=Nelumbo nucifera TaxID=4432 RepID=A0A822Z8U9_NELNU|nr:PREDICTED: probable indole-3-pyruvate monooxygenase YUCCA10 [Nelumbo nucifera]DAD39885.1 TPA_asm: hypothetical protein HUJ06_014208 [Nelumbo nucifera]
MEEVTVVIIGAGPSGLATSVCLNNLSIPNVILEREDCHSSLWKKRSYDCLKLHLGKEFSFLPYMPHPSTTPTFMTKNSFIQYMDEYVSHFNLCPRYCRTVESAFYDKASGQWNVVAKNKVSNEDEVYLAMFLVVATGENSQGYIPEFPGLDSFRGSFIHSSQYKSGREYVGKDVLVVGSGNSGMEIAFNLAYFGAKTSIVVQSPVHVLSREMVYLGMNLLKFLPMFFVDNLVTMLSKLQYGDLSRYGIVRPKKGPFHLKQTTGRSPVLDVGTMDLIVNKDIKVFPRISRIEGTNVTFENDKVWKFDDIIFATGFKTTIKDWLEVDGDLLNDNGMPKTPFPNQWKGKNGLYFAGFSSRGLAGVSMDAENIAEDINMAFGHNKKKWF